MKKNHLGCTKKIVARFSIIYFYCYNNSSSSSNWLGRYFILIPVFVMNKLGPGPNEFLYRVKRLVARDYEWSNVEDNYNSTEAAVSMSWRKLTKPIASTPCTVPIYEVNSGSFISPHHVSIFLVEDDLSAHLPRLTSLCNKLLDGKKLLAAVFSTLLAHILVVWAA